MPEAMIEAAIKALFPIALAPDAIIKRVWESTTQFPIASLGADSSDSTQCKTHLQLGDICSNLRSQALRWQISGWFSSHCSNCCIVAVQHAVVTTNNDSFGARTDGNESSFSFLQAVVKRRSTWTFSRL
jgi:hypothetical protein